MVEATMPSGSDKEPYRGVMLEWASQVLSWEKVSPRLVELYAGAFSEAEMRAMIAFYRTPTGQKVVAEWPALLQRQAAIGQELASEHRDELERLLLQRQRELEGQPGTREATRRSAKETVSTLHTAGVAMMSWLTDVIAEREPTDAQRRALAADAADADADNGTIDWSRCPAISHQELEVLLVDTYLAELPRRDGWGHEIEYCANRENPWVSKYTVGARSPGRDGRFEPGPYRPAAFDSSDVDRDVVWLDGFFVTRPEYRPQ
jgi:hypothetical protein